MRYLNPSAYFWEVLAMAQSPLVRVTAGLWNVISIRYFLSSDSCIPCVFPSVCQIARGKVSRARMESRAADTFVVLPRFWARIAVARYRGALQFDGVSRVSSFRQTFRIGRALHGVSKFNSLSQTWEERYRGQDESEIHFEGSASTDKFQIVI